MAVVLAQEICRDSNAVAGLSAVTDANLQTATESAANGVIALPLVVPI